MNDKLSKSIERIRETRPALNEVADDAQAIVVRVEKFLEHVGIPAYVKIVGEKWLAYDRLDGKFRILVATTDDKDPPINWCSCPRQIKLESFRSLPQLLMEIAKEASSLSRKASETAETVKQIRGALDATQDTKENDNGRNEGRPA